MKPTLKPGLIHRFFYKVPVAKTVPHLYDGGSLGVHIDVSHKAATPVGFTITVEAECVEVKGPRAKFAIKAHDGIDEIGSGIHERFIVTWDRFNKSVAAKTARALPKVDA